jgi:carbon storage regulator CsrA
MLVLTRRTNEDIVICDDILVRVCKVRNGVVKLGIVAPKHVNVVRSELLPGPGEIIGHPASVDPETSFNDCQKRKPKRRTLHDEQ